ncbi:MAG: helix-turn-helix transcriptional regulator [Clostridia bacterium]|nr:helix-turn-helix transcriptional regulator [Clostridia bacterium]
MLKDNIKSIRKSKGLSQEELAIKLNVVRQTISKWEQGLSVPDSELLVALSDALDTPVNTLLGENIPEEKTDSLKEIAEKLEIINLQLAQRKERGRKFLHWILISMCVILVAIFIVIATLGNTYMEWDYNDPELAILGVGIHSFVWIFVRIAPIVFIGSMIGIGLTRKKH